MSYEDLNLFEHGFLNNQTKWIQADASYYCANLQMVGVLIVEFTFAPNGMVHPHISVRSFRVDNYISNVRLIFEVLFFIIYINYLFMEVLKVYWRVQKVIDQDNR